MALHLSRSTSAKLSLAVLSAASLCLTTVTQQQAQAVTLVQWTFEGLSASTTAASVGNFAPDVNPGAITAAASGVHASSSSVWSAPAGNGSSHSLSGNNWATNDYFEFDLDTTGYSNLTISFDAVGSATGPRDFKVQYSTDAGHTTFTDLPATYSLTSAPAWTTTAASTSAAEHFSFSLSAISGLTGIRLVDTSTTSINGGTVGTAGTSRIDNVTFEGDPVPEPASMAVLGAGAAFLLGRRRNRQK